MSKIPQKVGFNLAESRYLNLFRILFKVRKFQTVNSQKRNWKFFLSLTLPIPRDYRIHKDILHVMINQKFKIYLMFN